MNAGTYISLALHVAVFWVPLCLEWSLKLSRQSDLVTDVSIISSSRL